MQEAEVIALPRIIVKRWRDAGVDILVNNAGMGRDDASLMDGNTASWVEMVSTNTLGVCMCTREAVQVIPCLCLKLASNGCQWLPIHAIGRHHLICAKLYNQRQCAIDWKVFHAQICSARSLAHPPLLSDVWVKGTGRASLLEDLHLQLSKGLCLSVVFCS